jgi:hypothetical protein
MCSSIGVDPLAGPRKGGWWAELLGLGDWHYELGVQIVDVCVSTRDRNGGLIAMSEVIRLVSKLRGMSGGSITEEDVVRSISLSEQAIRLLKSCAEGAGCGSDSHTCYSSRGGWKGN